MAVLSFGIECDPEWTNSPSASRCVPVNCYSYRLTRPDGTKQSFRRDLARPGVILGESPWVGKVSKGGISVWADPSLTGGRRRAAYDFAGGQLRKLFLDGVEYRFPAGDPQMPEDAASLWPDRKERSAEKGSDGDIWKGGGRLRLWYANPNAAGMLGAELMILGLGLLLALRGWPRLASALPLLAGLYVTCASSSRGAMLAAVIGCGALAAGHWRKLFTRRGVVAVLVLAALVAGGLGVTGQYARIARSFDRIDEGNSLRLTVAKAVPEMFADAPWGWQGGEVPARSACLNWYVDGQAHVIRTHLLTLTELGWFGGAAYLTGWFVLIGLGVCLARRGRSLPLALWAGFAAAGLFNPVYAEGTLWIVPVGAMAAALAGRRDVLRPSCAAKTVASAFVLSALAVIALVCLGRAEGKARAVMVKSHGRAAFVNGANPLCWILEDEKVLGGWQGFPGRELLAEYANHPEWKPMAYVYDLKDLPDEVDNLVLPGRAAAAYLREYAAGRPVCKARQIVFLSPSVGPSAVPESLLSESRVRWYAGRFLALRDPSYRQERDWVKIVPGAEQYLLGWQRVVQGVFSQQGKTTTKGGKQ